MKTTQEAIRSGQALNQATDYAIARGLKLEEEETKLFIYAVAIRLEMNNQAYQDAESEELIKWAEYDFSKV